jgi:hypothetical protein
MATTAMNIIQRLGGPTLTTLCATFLGWRLAEVPVNDAALAPFTAAFLLLCVLHGLLVVAAMQLPLSLPRAAERRITEVANSFESIAE